jgi:WD40 repeat protein
MKTNITKFLMLILTVCLSAAWIQAQGVEVKKIAPNAQEFAVVMDANFTPSGEFLVVQSDVGFYIIPTEKLDEITGNLDDLNVSWTEGWAITFMPSGKIVVKSRRSLYTLDPQTETGDEIYTASSDNEEKGNYLNDGELVVVSENLIISGGGDYDFFNNKGTIIRFDVRRGSYKRGARIDGFKNAKLSPDGKYVLYEHGSDDYNYADLYDIARNVNYPIPQRFDFKRNFPKYKETLVDPLVWVTPNRFVATVDENQFEEFKASANPLDIPDTPAWLVLFDASGGKIVWKHQLKNVDASGVLQLLSKTKAFFDDTNGIYEVSLADGKLTKLPTVAGTLFTISPDKTKMAYLDENRIIVSAAASGANKQTVFEVSKSWQDTISSIKWSPDGKRLLISDKNRLLIIRL